MRKKGIANQLRLLAKEFERMKIPDTRNEDTWGDFSRILKEFLVKFEAFKGFRSGLDSPKPAGFYDAQECILEALSTTRLILSLEEKYWEYRDVEVLRQIAIEITNLKDSIIPDIVEEINGAADLLKRK